MVIVDTYSKSPCVDDDEGTSDVNEYPSNQEVLMMGANRTIMECAVEDYDVDET